MGGPEASLIAVQGGGCSSGSVDKELLAEAVGGDAGTPWRPATLGREVAGGS